MRNYKDICGYNLVYNFLIWLSRLQSSVFVVHISNAFWHGSFILAFPKGSSQNKIFLLLVIFQKQKQKGKQKWQIETADINKAVSDSLKEIIINAINEIRSIKKRPDNKAIIYFINTNSATNYKQEFIDSALNYMDRHNMITNRPNQGRSQNLKEVPQNLTEVFNIDDVTANDVIQRNQHRKGKQINLSYIVITDVKLASQLKKDSEFCFSFLW